MDFDQLAPLKNNSPSLYQLPGNVSSHTLGGLTPYQQYSFQLEACTVAGCTRSDSSSSVYTLQAGRDSRELWPNPKWEQKNKHI